MSIAAQKTAIALGLENATQRKVLDAIALDGKALPAAVVSVSNNGWIVTVSFAVNAAPYTLPKVQCGVGMSKYSREPLQPGDQGLVVPADVTMGGVNGLGSGTADLTQPGNLSALTFIPASNANFPAPIDQNANELQGPTGVILHDLAQTIVLYIQPGLAKLVLPAGLPFVVEGNMVVNGGLQLSGPITAVGGGTYAEPIQTSGDVVAGYGGGDQVSQLNHTHEYNDPDGASTPAQTNAPTPGT
jgi:hypothetical protein